MSHEIHRMYTVAVEVETQGGERKQVRSEWLSLMDANCVLREYLETGHKAEIEEIPQTEVMKRKQDQRNAANAKKKRTLDIKSRRWW